MGKEAPFFEALLDKPVSLIKRGYGSAIVVDFGELSERKAIRRSSTRQMGECTLLIEWSWRIEKPRSILGGSWSSERRWPGMFEKLTSETVTKVELQCHLPEICVSFSNGFRLVSFMTEESQPEWTLHCRKPNLGVLGVERGALRVYKRNS